ncbi:hypothetical protein JCM8202_003375 [Rhodotorula sphaerocarpa]
MAPFYMKAAEHAVKSQFAQPNSSAAPPANAAAAPAPAPPPPIRASRPPPPPKAGVRQVRALYDYEGDAVEDLPIAEGENLTVLESVSTDWLKCRNRLGSEGLVPASYVQ